MITTVCLNPAIDQSAEVEHLEIGGTNRLANLRSEIGGKGINVAIVLRRLQSEVRCVSCVGNADAGFFTQGMKRESVPFYAVGVPGSVRRNLKLIETDGRTVTELNQPGATVNAKALGRFQGLLSAQTETNSFTALCGSLPPGCGEDTYQTMMQAMPDRRWVVDTSGAAMRHALQFNPFLIKPNHEELEEIVGSRLEDLNAVKNAAVSLCKTGVSYVAASLGKQGALVTDGKRTVYAPAVKITPLFTVGGGDALLAGLLHGVSKKETVFDSLRYGIAAAAVSVEGGSIHAFAKERFFELLPKVETRRIS